MKRKIPFIIYFILFFVQCLASQDNIYFEDFESYANGTTFGTSWIAHPPGKCDSSTDYDFNVLDGKFVIRNVEGFDCGCAGVYDGNNQNILEFGPFDITNYCGLTVDFNLEIGPGLECADANAPIPLFCGSQTPLQPGHDMFYVKALVDNVSFDLLYSCGNQILLDERLSILPEGKALVITVMGGTGTPSETYALDDFLIEGKTTNQNIEIISNISGPICEGHEVTLTANSSGPWLWSNGATTQSITITPPIGSKEYIVLESSGCSLNQGTYSTVVMPNPSADAGSDVQICEGETVTLTANGGTQYYWNTGATTQTIDVSPSSNTTYSVTVSQEGCTDVDEVVVDVAATPTVNAGSDKTICAGKSVTLTGSGATSYEWDFGSTDQSVVVSPITTTIYTLTGSNGTCSATDEVTVIVKPTPSASISGDANICEGEFTDLTASGGGTYSWSTGSTVNLITVGPTVNTTYQVTVTDNNCTDIAQVEVVVNPKPAANAGVDEQICEGESAILTANGGGNYNWSNGASSQSITVSPASNSTYTVTVSLSGCTDIDEVDIEVSPVPVVDAGANQTICLGQSVTLNGSGAASYLWDFGSSDSNPTVSPTTTTTYTLTGTTGLCGAIDQVTITVEPLPVANITGNSAICSEATTTLSTSATGTYLWSNGSTSNSIDVSPTSTTIYSVTVTNNGCSEQDQVEVVVTPTPTANAGSDQDICEGESVALDATGGDQYKWSTEQITSSITVSPSVSTAYSVTVSQEGCTDTDIVIVNVTASPDVNAGKDQTICEGEQAMLTGSGADNYLWDFGSNDASVNVTPSQTTTFSLEGTTGLCSAIDKVTVFVASAPQAHISGKTTICNGDTTILTASGGNTYQWSNGSSTNSIVINPTSTSNYSVTITNGACEVINQTKIEVLPIPIPLIEGSQTFCPGSSTSLNINGNYPFVEWNINGSVFNESSISIDQPGILDVRVIDEFGCVGSTSLEIKESPELIPLITGSEKICEGSSSVLDVGNSYDTYQWSTGASTSAITVTGANTYGVSVSTNDGCAGSTSLTLEVVPNPKFEISGNNQFCEGSETLLSIPEYPSIEWSNGRSTSSNLINVPGNYRVDIIDENGCSGFSEIQITESPLPTIQIIGNSEFCSGDSSLLQINGSFENILWSNGNNTAEVFVKTAGIWTVQVEDVNGCSNISSIELIENVLPQPEIIGPFEICTGDEYELYTSSLYDIYLWNNSSNSDTITISSGGAYSVQVIDENGCIGSDLIEILEYTPPLFYLKPRFAVCNFFVQNRAPVLTNLDTAFFENYTNGYWTGINNSINIEDSSMVNFEGVAPGNYEFSYTTTDANFPCSNQSESIIIEVLDCQCPNINLNVIDTLCSISDELDLSTIQLSDFQGSWQFVNAPTSNLPSIIEDKLDASDMAPGNYELEFRLNDGIAPLGCSETKSMSFYVAPHINADLKIIEPACEDSLAKFEISLEGGDEFNLTLVNEQSEIIQFESISSGFIFEIPMSETTNLAFEDISSNISTCGFIPSASSYTFSPSSLDAELIVDNKAGDFGVSCFDASDGIASIEIKNGNAPYTYNWSTGATTQSISNLSAGEYSVTVIDGAGCTFEDDIEITAPPAQVLRLNPIAPRCGAGPGSLELEQIISYDIWELYIDGIIQSQQSLPTVITNIQPGNHLLEAVNSNGCFEAYEFNIPDASSFEINIDDVNISLGESLILQPEIPFDVESIRWSPSTYLNDSLSNNVRVTKPLNSITYTIAAISTDGCIITKNVSVNVDKERNLMIPTGFSPNGDLNNDSFIIHARSDVLQINSISIYNRRGEEVYKGQNIAPNQSLPWNWTFQNEPLPSDMYVWIAQVNFIDGAEVHFTGNFTLIR